MSWIPLKIHSTFTLQKSTIKLDKLVEKCKKCGYTTLAITEQGNLFSAVKVFKECKKAGIKPILGAEFYVKNDDKIGTITVLAKNLQGWKNLIKAISDANKPENYNKEKEIPLLDLAELARLLDGQCIVYVGAINSIFAKNLFTDYLGAIQARSYDQAKALVRTDWEIYSVSLLHQIRDLFGEANVFLEVQICYDSIECCQILNKLVRWLGKKNNVKVIGTADPYYLDKEDAEDQRIILSSREKVTLENVQDKIILNKNTDYEDLIFFRGSNSYLPSPEQTKEMFTEQEILNTKEVASLCESYEILSNPKVPNFKCPDGLETDKYIRKLCNEGWNQKIKDVVPKEQHPQYLDRIRYEMGIVEGAGLASYFLVMADLVSWAKKQGWMVGEGRGSAAGCMLSYLLDITELDPIEDDLMFERFYDEGRNTPGNITLPDIDIDFPVAQREKVIKRIEELYGVDKVAQMATFSRLQGRSALKEVLRVKQRCGNEEMNQITSFIPDESKIADDLQEAKDAGEETSIIKWALENNGDKLKQWCRISSEGKLEGEFARDFEQAIRLEGLKRQQGKHASGIVVANDRLDSFCPLLYDSSTGKLCIGWDMFDADAAGCVKLDCLGSAVLDHMMDAISIITTGDYPNEY